MYTWYVNSNMDIQVYEGFVPEGLIYEFANEREASEHIINPKSYMLGGKRWDSEKASPEVLSKVSLYAKCKYYIPNQYAEAFFVIIGQPVQYIAYNNGTTNYNVGDLLD